MTVSAPMVRPSARTGAARAARTLWLAATGTEPQPALPQAQVRDGQRLPGGARVHPGSLLEVLFDLGEEIGRLAGRGCPLHRAVLVNHGQRAAISAQKPGDRLDDLAQGVGVVADPVRGHVVSLGWPAGRQLGQDPPVGGWPPISAGRLAQPAHLPDLAAVVVHRHHLAEPTASLRYPLGRR